MIRRNQEMRERASRRRSSAGNRGTRMSENLGRGDISKSDPFIPLSLLPSFCSRLDAWYIVMVTRRYVDVRPATC
jgi:hypothetical protein